MKARKIKAPATRKPVAGNTIKGKDTTTSKTQLSVSPDLSKKKMG